MLLTHALAHARSLGAGFGPAPAVARPSVPSAAFETGGHLSSSAGASAVSDEPITRTGAENLAAWVLPDASGMASVSLGSVKA